MHYLLVKIANDQLLYCWTNSSNFTGMQIRKEWQWDHKIGKLLLLALFLLTLVSYTPHYVNSCLIMDQICDQYLNFSLSIWVLYYTSFVQKYFVWCLPDALKRFYGNKRIKGSFKLFCIVSPIEAMLSHLVPCEIVFSFCHVFRNVIIYVII